MRRYVGIDPGLGGAIASLGPDDFSVDDVPVVSTARNGKRRLEYDVPAMFSLLRAVLRDARDGVAVLELAHPHPKEGVSSSFRSGFGAGLWTALLVAVGFPYRVVPPVVWRRSLGLRGRDKNAVRLEAQRRWPLADLARVKDHGRADALFLAAYAKSVDSRPWMVV